MNRNEIVDLLTLAAAYDQRTVGKADVNAWLATVSKLGLDEAQCAVIAHYQVSRERVMPADVWNRCRSASSRLPAARVLPERVAGADPLRWHRAWQDALAASAARVAACRDVVLACPEARARLCEPPLRYARPEQWNGSIPPELWNGALNDAPERVALLAILETALAFRAGDGQ